MLDPRLKNFLKLPKASNWLYYEWFYSDIDKAIFDMDSEFIACLKTSFPNLKTTKLSRIHWCKIRKLLGKPRRCSPSFFNEERNALKMKRDKIRALWRIDYDKTTDLNTTIFINNLIMGKGLPPGSSTPSSNASAVEEYFLQDLPPYIPHPLIVGSKVMSRVRRPCDGMFRGRITAIDHSKWEYRITFDQPFLGTQSIPDFEIMSWREGDNGVISVTSILKTNNILGNVHRDPNYPYQQQSQVQTQLPHFMRLQPHQQTPSKTRSPASPSILLLSPAPNETPKNYAPSPYNSPVVGRFGRTPNDKLPDGAANEPGGSEAVTDPHSALESPGLYRVIKNFKPDLTAVMHSLSPQISPDRPIPDGNLNSYDEEQAGAKDKGGIGTTAAQILAATNDWRAILLRNIQVENGRMSAPNNTAYDRAADYHGNEGRTLACGRLETLVRVSACYKLLMYKAKHLDTLRKMNREAEKMHYTTVHANNSFHYAHEFKFRYANLVLEIINLDRSLFELCNKVSSRPNSQALAINSSKDSTTGALEDASGLDYLRYDRSEFSKDHGPPGGSRGRNDGSYDTWARVKDKFYFDEAAQIVDTVLGNNQSTYTALTDLAKSFHRDLADSHVSVKAELGENAPSFNGLGTAESVVENDAGSAAYDQNNDRGGPKSKAECATQILNLITRYTSTLIQLKLSPSSKAYTNVKFSEQKFAGNEHHQTTSKEDTTTVNMNENSSELFRLESLAQTICEIKDKVIDEKNISCFRDQVEVHINHLKNMIINARRPVIRMDDI